MGGLGDCHVLLCSLSCAFQHTSSGNYDASEAVRPITRGLRATGEAVPLEHIGECDFAKDVHHNRFAVPVV